MRYSILLCFLILSGNIFANPIERNSVRSISKRLDRLEFEISRLAQSPADSKSRSHTYISLRLRRLENRIATLNTEDNTKLSLKSRIQMAREKIRSDDHTKVKPDSAPMGTGIIKGRIKDAETEKPITDIWIEVDIYDSKGDFVSYGYANDYGRYHVSRLSEGTYYAVTYGVQEETDYVDQLYDNIPCYDSRCNIFSGKPISVTSGSTTTGINFNLVHGAHVTGYVVDAKTNEPLFDEQVDIYDSIGHWGLYSYAYTDVSGFYDTGGYATGEHYAATNNFNTGGSTFIDELFSNISCWGLQCNITGGNPLRVITGETTSGVNFSLDLGGRFSGRITDAKSNFSSGPIFVSFYDSAGESIDITLSDADGYYEFPGLVTGNYFASAGDPFDSYHNEFYDNIPCENENCPFVYGTPIAVTTGQITSGIDFALEPYDHVTGKVVDAESNNPASAWLGLYDSNGNLHRARHTDSNGIYHIRTTAPGIYFLKTSIVNQQHMDAMYSGIPCFDQPCMPTDGTPIVVTEGSVTSGIDFSLEPCLYCSDFRNSPNNWTYLNAFWNVSNDSLIGSAIQTRAVAIANPAFGGCSTCSVSATMKTEGGIGNALSLIGWYKDDRNLTELIMKQKTGKWVLRQRVNGAIVASATASLQIQPDVFYKAEIGYTGTDLHLMVDDVPILSLTPVGNLFGTVGFKVKYTTGHFGAIIVKEYETE